MDSKGQVGQKEMKCILKFEKYFHMSQCVTQVSDVAHGPLVIVSNAISAGHVSAMLSKL
jgi:hypothetical protein